MRYMPTCSSHYVIPKSQMAMCAKWRKRWCVVSRTSSRAWKYSTSGFLHFSATTKPKWRSTAKREGFSFWERTREPVPFQSMTQEEEIQIVSELRLGTGWRVLAQRFRRGGQTIAAIAQKHNV